MDLSQRAALPGGIEWRSYPAQFEVRGLTGPTVELRGYATTFDQPYEMFDQFGAYTEVARGGMLTKTLSESPDVAYLANHTGLTMARTKAGTLDLAQDATGFNTVARMNTSRTDVRDLVTAVEDGNVDQMSYAFRITRQEWSPDYDQRDLLEVNMNRGDVSAVNFGANPFTSVGLRAFRSPGAAQLNSLALDLRAGKTLTPANIATLTRVLHLIASADDAVDAAQPLLAGILGVPNPDADESQKNAATDPLAVALLDVEQAAIRGAEALGYLETLREQIALEAETAA